MIQSPHRPNSDRFGFLLTETLATFTISAFVLLGLVSASSVLLRAVDRSISQVQNVDDLSRTLDAIARDVSGLARARFDGVEPQPYVFQGGPNSLFFVHREIGRDGLSEMHVVSLREIVVGSGTRLVRADAVLSVRITSFDALRYGPAREFATGTARLRFSYVAPLRPDGTRPPPQKSWSNRRMLPVAVLIEAVDPNSGSKLLTSRVAIHVNADIGCLERGTPATSDKASISNLLPPQAVSGLAPMPFVSPAAAATSDDGSCSTSPLPSSGVPL